MKGFKRFTRWEKAIVITVFGVISIFIYIWVSTTHINKMYYQEFTFKINNYAKNVIDWRNAPVTVVKFKDCMHNNPSILSAKISRALLFLNGGYAVRVEIHISGNGIDDFIPYYFNPFTKQCIAAINIM